jgi:copper transport protein
MKRVPIAGALATIAAAFVFGIACLAILTPTADAHASLLASHPAANSSLSKPPDAVVLSFSEPPDPALSRIELIDAAGRPVPGVSKPESVAGYPGRLRATLSEPPPEGIYTVDWRSVSAVDGHVTNGAFAFGIGVTPPPSAVSGVPPAVSWTLSAVLAVGRWSLYWGLALLFGAATTCIIALRSRLPAGGVALLRGGLLLAAVGLSVLTLAERAAAGVPSLLPLFETRPGYLLLAEGVALLICAVAVAATDVVPRRATLTALGAAAMLAMLVHVVAGHADAPSALLPFNVVEQWVHMLAVGAWIGGLAWLLLGIRGLERDERMNAVKSYSTVAGLALGVVVVTGLLRAITEVRSVGDLFNTTYGRTLLLKVSLVAVIALLGALNRYRLLPALAIEENAVRPFRRAAGGEVAIAAGVLAVTAVLAGLAPAFASRANPIPGGSGVTVSGSDYATTARVHLTIAPGTVGRNDFVMTASDYDTGKPLTGVRGVTLNFSLPSRPAVGQTTVALKQTAPGAWQGSAVEPSVAGNWRIEVVIQRSADAVVVQLAFGALPASSP